MRPRRAGMRQIAWRSSPRCAATASTSRTSRGGPDGMDVSEVRRRLRGAIEKARQQAIERRSRGDAAARDYEEFLTRKAAPLFHQIASALVAEGHHFKVFSPAGSVRLASDRSPEEFVELTLDTD